MSFQPELLSTFKPTLAEGVQSNWTYTSIVDDLATMSASGYFDPTATQPVSSSQTGENLSQNFKINDKVSLVGTDGSAQFLVATLNPVTLTLAVPFTVPIVASGQFIDAGGSAFIQISDTDIPAGGRGWATMESSVNPVFPIATLVTNELIAITFSADPGASTIHYWVTL